MTPGIYRDMPAEEYHAKEGLSYSRAKHLLKCPALCKYHMDNPRKPTRPQVFGSAVHCRLLFGKDAFRKTYDLKLSWATKDGKLQREACGGDDEFLLTEDEFERVEGCARSVEQHEKLGKLIGRIQEREVSLFWTDRERNVPCKARLDGWFPGTVVDLKTVGSADEWTVLSQLRKLQYHVQAAHYLAGAKACGLQADIFCLVCIEAQPPHYCAAYTIDRETIEAAELIRFEAIARFNYCLTTGDWPTYPAITDIGLRKNDLTRIEEAYGKREGHEGTDEGLEDDEADDDSGDPDTDDWGSAGD